MGSRVIVELQISSMNWAKVVEEIVDMERKIFPEQKPLTTYLEEALKKENFGLLYSEVNGEVVGYVFYYCASSLCDSILDLAVKENHRRQGHGEALLKAAIEKCRTRNVHRILLHVDPLSTPAMSLYKKLGFQVDNLVEGYYSSHRDAYRMYLDFDSN